MENKAKKFKVSLVLVLTIDEDYENEFAIVTELKGETNIDDITGAGDAVQRAAYNMWQRALEEKKIR